MTGKHKAYCVVLGIGVLAFFLDKTLLAPEESVGAQPADTPSGIAVAPSTSPRTSPPSASENHVATQLDKIANARQLDLGQMPDAFAEPAWTSADAVVVDCDDTPATEAEAAFRDSHQLTAVMASEDGGTVIINRRALRIGDSIEGFTLVSVTNGAARFSAPGSNRVIELSVNGRK
jgi:hypothetical protein